ncbi:HEAT repeat domain-containing protein [Streptomyces sp. NPDC088794]|uniref:HEAT repeat domain-containing protein n=1 Tax=Streptomyces sp. NPDC088794 TaxID=3365902 RepID=UPI003810153C
MTTGHQVAFFLRELETGETCRKAAAAKGLGKLGGAEHAAVLVRAAADSDVVEAYGRLLSDPDHHVRINALEALYELDVPGDVSALVRLLGDPTQRISDLASTMVWGSLKDPDVKAELARTAQWGEHNCCSCLRDRVMSDCWIRPRAG